jgi:hypothetical protein
MKNKEQDFKIPYEMRGEPMEFVPPEKEAEPFVLSERAYFWIVLWAGAVTCVLGAIILERLI